jgi:hypothetical protein
MDVTALLLSRIQFAFIVSFHIIFPSFTIGLAPWLTVRSRKTPPARDRYRGSSPVGDRAAGLGARVRSFPQTAYRGVVSWQKR